MIKKLFNTLLNKNFLFVCTYYLKTFKRWYKEKRWLSDEDFIKQKFEQKTGHALNLDNPTTFNEKLQWLKLHDRTPLHTICADKLAVREYVKEKIGEEYLIPLLFQTASVHELRIENMPKTPYIIKTNHNSAGYEIIRDAYSLNWALLRMKFSILLKTNHYHLGREWQYKHIKPMILIEKLLLDENGAIPYDYKLYCFNGSVQYIQIIHRHKHQVRVTFYDLNWNLVECKHKKKKTHPIERPTLLAEMIDIAETLASNFDYVRVDLYCVHNRIYFGELTFHPASGWGKEFSYSECDHLFGKQLFLTEREDS